MFAGLLILSIVFSAPASNRAWIHHELFAAAAKRAAVHANAPQK